MNIQEISILSSGFLTVDNDGNITSLGDAIFVSDINGDMTIDYNGNQDYFYYVDSDGNITSY